MKGLDSFLALLPPFVPVSSSPARFFVDLPLWKGCVCVCVRLRERERERVLESDLNAGAFWDAVYLGTALCSTPQ